MLISIAVFQVAIHNNTSVFTDVTGTDTAAELAGALDNGAFVDSRIGMWQGTINRLLRGVEYLVKRAGAKQTGAQNGQGSR